MRVAKVLKKFFKKSFASGTTLALALGSLALGSVASPSNAEESYSFSRCVQDKRSANVLIMMDESGSVYKSDPTNLRVAGAEVLISRLQRVADVYSTSVNVMLAGFGDNFVERSQSWVELKPGTTDGSTSLVNTAREWVKPNANQRETDTLSSLKGATAALAEKPSESCKLFVFFKDGVDFQSFNKSKPTVHPDYKDIQKLLDAGNNEEAEEESINEICRKGGLADALRVEDNIFTFGVALNTTQGQDQEVDAFRSLIQGGGCGDLPGKGKLIEIDDTSNLPSIFGSALDPDFIPTNHTGEFTVDMKAALTSVNILSSRIVSTFDDFTITLAPTCTDKEPIRISRGASVDKSVGSVKVVAKWVGADPATSETLNITLQNTDPTNRDCWVGLWKINPGTKTYSELYFDADLSAVAKFDSDRAVLVKGDDNIANQSFNLEIQRPSNKQVVPAASLDADLDFTITGYLRNASTKTLVPSSLDNLTITKATVSQLQTLKVENAQLGDYELVLTMDVSVKDFTENLSPISTQTAVKVGTPAAAPTISGVTVFGNIDGVSRTKGTVIFQGSKDDDFKISFAAKETRVEATQFPKNLEYQIFLPAGTADDILIPKGATVEVPVEIAVKLADGQDGVNAQGTVRGNLVFAANAQGVTQDAVEVEGEFSATQLASANIISQIFWTIFFMVIGLAIPVAALVLITILLSRFPDKNVSEAVTSAAFTVKYDNGVVTNAAELTQQAADLRNFFRIDVAADRKSATVGYDTFKVKVNPFSLKAISHAELISGSAVGANSTGDGKPYMSLNLGSEWVFHTDPNTVNVFAEASSGQGTLVLVVNFNGATAPELVADFLRTSADVLSKLPQKSAAGILGDDSSGFGNPNNGNNGGFVGI